jgi:hypothetical protein
VPYAVAIGEFSSPPDANPDVVALASVPAVGGTEPAVLPSRFYLIPGRGDGDLDASGQTAVELAAVDAFDPRSSIWVVGDLDGGGTADEIIGIDRSWLDGGQRFTLPGRLLVIRPGEGLPTPLGLPDGLSAARDLLLHDMDLDGDLDLVVGFAGEYQTEPAGDGAVTGAGLAVLWNEGGALDPSRLSRLDAPGTYLLDVDVADLDGDDVRELVFLSAGTSVDGVFISRLDAASRTYGEPELLVTASDAQRLEVGDLDGDGLADLALTNTFELTVLRQRPADPRGGSAVVGTPLTPSEAL